MARVSDGRLSPNQAEKQRVIVDAARTVLARDGLAGATARAVADASPLTKSAIHYYFPDMDVLVDRAMSGHIEAFADGIREAAGRHHEPEAALRAATDAYLAMFADTPAGLTLWHEYWTDAVRRGRGEVIEPLFAEVAAIFTRLLEACAVAEPVLRSHALTSFLMGTATWQAVASRDEHEVRREVGLVAGVDLARAGEKLGRQS